MKNGYIKPENRKKILLLCDDIRLASGVANVAKELVINSCHVYNWVNVGGSPNGDEHNKRMDLSTATGEEAGVEDANVVVYPQPNYGTADLLRQLIKIEKPDALFLITDPRYFTWLFEIENEIRKEIPIIYLNIWDEYPAPMYNKPYYESCDLLMGISKQTVNINTLVLGDKAKNKLIKYVPHGLNTKHYFPINKDNEQWVDFQNFKNNIFVPHKKDFVIFFNSRNITRKRIPDTMLAWKMFLDKLTPEEADKCVLILHTEVEFQAGTDLMAVKEFFFGKDDHRIVFSTNKIPPQQLNFLYNLADAQILLTSNEGWGLSLTEAMLAGTPIIANVTGGMQDQMRFVDENGNWFTPSAEIPSNHNGTYQEHGEWAFPVYPKVKTLQGSPPTPYIWDDLCDPKDATERLMEIYKMAPEERKEKGLAGMKWALGNEAGFTSEKMTARVIDSIEELFSTWEPREKYEFLTMDGFEERSIPHALDY